MCSIITLLAYTMEGYYMNKQEKRAVELFRRLTPQEKERFLLWLSDLPDKQEHTVASPE